MGRKFRGKMTLKKRDLVIAWVSAAFCALSSLLIFVSIKLFIAAFLICLLVNIIIMHTLLACPNCTNTESLFNLTKAAKTQLVCKKCGSVIRFK